MGFRKTTALEVIEVIANNGLTADDLTGAALFRLVDALKPTLLFDEVDGVFGKRNNDTTEDLRKILNSGYKAGKRVFRIGGPQRNELQEFDVFCPKALAGLKDLPGTLAHRSIPIAMKPPRPGRSVPGLRPGGDRRGVRPDPRPPGGVGRVGGSGAPRSQPEAGEDS